MEGTFKGWSPNKDFGFIRLDDDSEDVFIHKSEVSSIPTIIAGIRLTFDVKQSEKGSSAVNVVVSPADLAKRERGMVRAWHDKGFGFISPANGGPDVFIHVNALPRELNAYLCVGDIVEYIPIEGTKGFDAAILEVVGWSAQHNHLENFADMGPSSWLKQLAILAEPEPWDFKFLTTSEPFPILANYIRYTFRRLEEMENGVRITQDGKYASFNTGLVTLNQEEIYALFVKNPRPDRQVWKLHGFQKASDWDFIEHFGSSAPPMANYFEDPSVLLYDRRCELFINIDHVMEQIDRFPKHLQENQYVARQLLISAEATTKKRVYRNYKTAVPHYYRDKGGKGSIQLLLPICLENPARADIALVVDKTETGDAYRGSTILTLDMAYNNARLLARPDDEWLQP